MPKSYTVGFENVELVNGLAPDKAVWLYMRATLLNDGDPDHPLWTDEVGSLPSDANRPGFDGFPHGDAGRYADGLVVGKPVTKEQINDAIKAAAAGPLKGVLATNDEPLVSMDFNHNPASSTFDLPQTQVIDGVFVRVLSWYDNEWGFSNRMADTALAMSKLG